MANKRFIVRHGLDNSGDNSVANTITNVAEPVNNSDAATKYYVDNAVGNGLPSQSGNNGKFLTTNGTTASWSLVPVTAINATGTPSSTTYLRGDGTWATVTSSGGTVTSITTTGANGVTISGGSTQTITTSGTFAIALGNITPTSISTGTGSFSGNVGIGTASPSTKLEVVGGYSTFAGLRIGGTDTNVNQIWQSNSGTTLGITANGGAIVFGQTSSEQMRLTAGGSLGIGTVSPAYKLDVNGTLNASGAITQNGSQVLTASNLLNYAQSTTEWYHSNRDFVNGTLITTSIDYSVTNGDPFVLEIRGNSYGSLIPFSIQIQGYIYNNTIINYGGYSIGGAFNIIAMNVSGNLCFWFARQAYWQGFNVKAYIALPTRALNKVTSITDVVEPTAGTKKVTITPDQVLRSGNYNSYAPTLTGGNASGTWGINVTGYSSYLSTTNQGLTGGQGLRNVSSTTDWSNMPIGYSAMFTANQTATGTPSTNYGYFIKVANRDGGGGWGGIWVDYSGGDTYVGNTTVSSSYATWYKLLSSTNYSSYALPLSGGTISGNLTVTGISNASVQPRTGFSNWINHNISAYTDASLISRGNTEDSWIWLDQASAQWGIYHRQIDSDLANAGQPTLPANSVGYVGGNNLTAYLCMADGRTFAKGGFITPDVSQAGLRNMSGTSWIYPDDGAGNMWIHNEPDAGGMYFDSDNYYIRYRSTTVVQINSGGMSVTGTLNTSSTLSQGGNQVLHAGNFSSYTLNRNGDNTTGIMYFTSNKGNGTYLGGQSNYSLQAYSSDGGAAAMSFHRGGYYAVNMGLDPDNVFRIGGWSASANRLQLDMSGNLTVPYTYANSFHIINDSNNQFTQGALQLRSSGPTIYFRDTDHNSAMLHCNSNIFYLLRGGNDTTTWATTNGYWPLEVNLSTNDATFGRHIYLPAGYAHAVYFNQTSANNENAGVGQIIATANDNFLRKVSPSFFKTALGLYSGPAGSGTITISTSAPSGGATNDIWLQW